MNTTKIEERKNIIVSLKSNYGERKNGIEKRIQYLKGISILNLTLTLFCGGIIISSILSELLGYNFFKWQKTGLLVILSLSFTLNLPNILYELKLLNHLKKINSKSEFDGIEKLNNELRNLINKLNKRRKSNRFLFALTILILIMGIWQMGFDNNNPYWDYMKLPVIAFYGIIIFRFILINKKLAENINETEKHCREHTL
tara:strand:+ start:4692 stop:5291 length:600 start_codon:yes stop_codon:yes gene_type:complete